MPALWPGHPPGQIQYRWCRSCDGPELILSWPCRLRRRDLEVRIGPRKLLVRAVGQRPVCAQEWTHQGVRVVLDSSTFCLTIGWRRRGAHPRLPGTPLAPESKADRMMLKRPHCNYWQLLREFVQLCLLTSLISFGLLAPRLLPAAAAVSLAAAGGRRPPVLPPVPTGGPTGGLARDAACCRLVAAGCRGEPRRRRPLAADSAAIKVAWLPFGDAWCRRPARAW